MRRAPKIILGGLGLLVLLTCMGVTAAIELPFTLAFGWIAYLRDVLPNVQVHWPTVASALACLLGVLVLAHTLARWLWRETAPAPAADAVRPPWRFRWTLTAAAVVLLLFTAGIAATGVTHQAAWLAKSDTRIFVTRFSRQDEHDKSECANKLEQIGYALKDYTASHAGQYPDSLDVLVSDANSITSHALVCPATDPDPYGSHREGDDDRPQYTYYARGLRAPLPARLPIASEPLTNHKLTGLNILFSDGKVEFHTPAQAAKILSRIKSVDSPEVGAPSPAPRPGGNPQ